MYTYLSIKMHCDPSFDLSHNFLFMLILSYKSLINVEKEENMKIKQSELFHLKTFPCTFNKTSKLNFIIEIVLLSVKVLLPVV